MSEEAKPCAWCNSPADVWHHAGGETVFCSNKKCFLHCVESPPLSAWNSRHTPDEGEFSYSGFDSLTPREKAIYHAAYDRGIGDTKAAIAALRDKKRGGVMSSFKMKAKHKLSGEVHEVWCLDDYFGKHKYGYIPNIDGGIAMREQEFYSQYEQQPTTEVTP